MAEELIVYWKLHKSRTEAGACLICRLPADLEGGLPAAALPAQPLGDNVRWSNDLASP